MFRGSSFHTIDTKGRIIVPARFRDIVKADGSYGVMLSRMDRGLVAYTYDGWRKIENRILSLAEKSESMRRFRRVFIGGSFECPCDKQDRVLDTAKFERICRARQRNRTGWRSRSF